MTLGTAMAISGAAVNPNMGSRTPPAALAMLMTFLNARLGYWAPTPNRSDWREPQARLWPFYLLREFLSQTNDLSHYCCLTDGGHFDNTGLYSLIERGCRFVVVADCGADPRPCFGDLGDAIRRCRIDFGVEIELDLTPLSKTNAGGRQFVVGTITYPADDSMHRPPDSSARRNRCGYIVWIKPMIQPEQSADVRQYGLENPSFPQQATANQWFDEAQFESYRRLGYLAGRQLFEGIEPRLNSQGITAMFEQLHRNFARASKAQPHRVGQVPYEEYLRDMLKLHEIGITPEGNPIPGRAAAQPELR